MKILLVKLSSLGDVLHNIPIVWDLRRIDPEAQIDWLVEEAYVDLLSPLRTTEVLKGIDQVIPIRLRRWKKNLKNGEFVSSIEEFMKFKSALRTHAYDVVIETQGLLKSALISRMAKLNSQGCIYGLANQTQYSGYEPMARWFYKRSVEVPFQCHAVDRSRIVAASANSQSPPDRMMNPPKFYPNEFIDSLQSPSDQQINLEHIGFDVTKPYTLCFHSTARRAKRWGVENWICIGHELSKRGQQVIFPWGNEAEKEISHRMARQVSGAIVPNAFSLREAFHLITRAKLTVGVDTGLTHLSAVMNCPTIELYCDSPRWKTEGYWSDWIHNLGDMGEPPSVEEVIQSMNVLLQST